jgi:hypothetical protein
MATRLDDYVRAADIVQLPTAGWREWLALPSLGISRIKAKVDNGARTSAIHTFDLEPYETESEEKRVRFKIHPIQGDLETVIECDNCPRRWSAIPLLEKFSEKDQEYIKAFANEPASPFPSE